MKKVLGNFTIIDCLLLPFLGLLLLIIGSFSDLSISQSAYIGSNPLSMIVSYIGKLPMYLCIALSGVLFFLYYFKKPVVLKKRLSFLFLIIPLGAGVIYGYDDLGDLGTMIGIVLGVVIIAILSAGFYFLVRKLDTKEFVQKGLILLVAAAFTFIITYVMKLGCMRPRYEYLLEVGDSYFMNWYQYGVLDITPLGEVDSHNLESFPSGHAAGASCLILLPLLFSIFPEPKSKGGKIAFALAPLYYGLFVLLVVLGRLLDGSHYISDLGMGLLIGSLPPLCLEAGVELSMRKANAHARANANEVEEENS